MKEPGVSLPKLAKTTSILIFILIVGIGLIPTVYAAWEKNIWSMVVYKRIIMPDTHLPLSEMPANFQRGLFWMARLAVRENDPDQAMVIIAQMQAPEDDKRISLVGWDLENYGYYSAAISAWIKVKDIDSLWRSAERATKTKRLDDALQAYQVALQLDSAAGVIPLADFFYWTLRDISSAEEVLQQALVTHPPSSYRSIWLKRHADFERDQKNWEEAGRLYALVLEANPNDAGAHIGMGWVYYERNHDVPAAISEFQKAIAIDPQEGSGYQEMGMLYFREERYVEADQWFRWAQERTPSRSWWYLQRIRAAVAAGNFPLAVSIYEDTISRFPDYAQVHYEMSWFFVQNNQSEDALKAIEYAVNLMIVPDQSYYVRAGKIYEWIGENEKALHSYRQALNINPDNPDALQGIARLAPPE